MDLLSIGYKHNSSAVLTFVVTKGAGSTVTGWSYEALFLDIYGNIHACNFPRPEVLNKYFDHCNVVDGDNHAHQGNLALEKCWITCNPYFMIWTTFIGMEVTDLWQIHRSLKARTFGNMSIKPFANRVAFDLLQQAQALVKKDMHGTQKIGKCRAKDGMNL